MVGLSVKIIFDSRRTTSEQIFGHTGKSTYNKYLHIDWCVGPHLGSKYVVTNCPSGADIS